jgi:putative FmdB family regulatory protein
MPIYEYRCEKCGDFEKTQRITDPPLDRCPTCRRKVRRLISSTSFQLKGSGWYVTDYARAGKGSAKDKDAASDGAGSTEASSGTSETTPKSESKAREKTKSGTKSATKSESKSAAAGA